MSFSSMSIRQLPLNPKRPRRLSFSESSDDEPIPVRSPRPVDTTHASFMLTPRAASFSSPTYIPDTHTHQPHLGNGPNGALSEASARRLGIDSSSQRNIQKIVIDSDTDEEMQPSSRPILRTHSCKAAILDLAHSETRPIPTREAPSDSEDDMMDESEDDRQGGQGLGAGEVDDLLQDSDGLLEESDMEDDFHSLLLDGTQYGNLVGDEDDQLLVDGEVGADGDAELLFDDDFDDMVDEWGAEQGGGLEQSRGVETLEELENKQGRRWVSGGGMQETAVPVESIGRGIEGEIQADTGRSQVHNQGNPIAAEEDVPGSRR
jgi:hypothetical protein